MRLKADSFVEKVSSWWESYHFQVSPNYIIASKLRALKNDLKKWNWEEFGSMEEKKYNLWKSLNELDLVEEIRSLSDEEKLKKTYK